MEEYPKSTVSLSGDVISSPLKLSQHVALTILLHNYYDIIWVVCYFIQGGVMNLLSACGFPGPTKRDINSPPCTCIWVFGQILYGI